MVTTTSRISSVLVDEPPTLASVFPPVIQIYSFAPDPQRSIIPNQPLDYHYMDDTTPHPVLVAELDMPRFSDGVQVHAFDVRPDPDFAPRRGQAKPFTQDPSKGVLVFELQVIVDAMDDAERDPPSFELFVLRETFVEMAVRGETRLEEVRNRSGEERFTPWRVEEKVGWEQWGYVNARLVASSMRSRDWVGSPADECLKRFHAHLRCRL